jgi:cytochrome c heme-lyase
MVWVSASPIPQCYSELAFWNSQHRLARYKLPFDRHDWVVDRCGEKVTYVIDFYSGKANPNVPGSVSFFLDVRPALSLSGIWDRIKMSFEKGEWL